MDILNKRVVRVMDLKRLSKTEFSTMLGISPAILSHISSGRNKPSVDILQKILTKYPDISAEWLLMGEGEMLKAQNISVENMLEALTTIETRTQDGIDTLIGVRELLKQQKERLAN